MENSRRVRLEIEYDGTDFIGWQKQPDGGAVQNEIENCLNQIFNGEILTVGSGRTDTGVHAEAQNLHFEIPRVLGDMELKYKLNRMLPNSIAVKKAWLAPNDFHALTSALSKTYRYQFFISEARSVFSNRYSWWLNPRMLKNGASILNLSRTSIEEFNQGLCHALEELSKPLLGKKDFKCFQSTGTEVPSTIRTIKEISWSLKKQFLYFRISGDGFLKQMVRNIVGTLVELVSNGEEISQKILALENIIESKDRKKAGAPAPAQGLFLERVEYSKDISKNCTEIP